MKKKVLIEIDEEVYEHIRESSGLAYAVEDYLHEVEWAIRNGTPLPKNHVIVEWHPIESLEEIPLKKSLLVCDCDKEITLGYAVRYKARFPNGSDDIRVSDWDGDRIKGIVAWMDLPTPYTEAEGEDKE